MEVLGIGISTWNRNETDRNINSGEVAISATRPGVLYLEDRDVTKKQSPAILPVLPGGNGLQCSRPDPRNL